MNLEKRFNYVETILIIYARDEIACRNKNFINILIFFFIYFLQATS